MKKQCIEFVNRLTIFSVFLEKEDLPF